MTVENALAVLGWCMVVNFGILFFNFAPYIALRIVFT